VIAHDTGRAAGPAPRQAARAGRPDQVVAYAADQLERAGAVVGPKLAVRILKVVERQQRAWRSNARRRS
jgi:hypothetical protein